MMRIQLFFIKYQKSSMEWTNNLKLTQKSLLNSSNNPFLKNIYAIAESNLIIKNRYIKIKKNPNIQKNNNYFCNNLPLQKSSKPEQINKRSQSEEFINKFIKCQKQRLAYKIQQPPEIQTPQEILIYIKSKSSGLQSAQDPVSINTSYFQQKRAKNIRQNLRVETKSVTKRQFQEFPKTEIHSANPKQRQNKTKSTACSDLQKSIKSNPVKKFEIKSPIKMKTTEIKHQRKTTEQKIEENKKNKPIIPYDFQQLSFIKSESYCVMEFPSNQLILSYRSKILLQIASLTKIMTCYLVIKLAQENNINMTADTVQIQDFVQEITGTSAQLVQGDILTIQQLLFALMLPSGNDAAISLADWGGQFFTGKTERKDNIKAFVREMNKTAKQLGLSDTRYGNPHGLPSNESRSCALDVCKLTAICMKIPIFNKIINTKIYRSFIKTAYNIDRQVYWQNTNKLLRRKGFLGVKTGITVTAGPCLASAYTFKNKTYIIVVLRANKVSRRFTQTRKILYWTLKKLHKQGLNPQQNKTLDYLNKRDRDLDSDNSQDQKQFMYSNSGTQQYVKRKKIIKYEL